MAVNVREDTSPRKKLTALPAIEDRCYESSLEDEWEKNSSGDVSEADVKSKAVVKYSTARSLANFACLRSNTDLNLPPSNWLSNSATHFGFQPIVTDSNGFCSFQIAHMFPDSVGEADVISDAENIKKLLKIAYSKASVSMMVHRVENTLLIDEFDVYRYLLRTSQSEWEWLRKFFFDHVHTTLGGEKDKGLFHRNKSRLALQQKSLVSKFLYHSLAVAEPELGAPLPQPDPTTDSAVPAASPLLPEPTPQQKHPYPAFNHQFSRNIMWTFEDIRMLIGTDLPIFGGPTHPCISLKLRDMSKPISVLTGIDHWLDNLMCNVPEVLMCCHLDGIVQKYELIKTEDLPHLQDSKFSPKLIRDVAQNILSFLKANATKAGHTYWLFKGKDDDIVKLYDLTSLCTDFMDDKDQNPFTVPVAMLLYRVARNMKQSPDSHQQQKTVLMLLKNCVSLLAKEKYPQIVTSAHYMLSDLYVPADTDPSSPELSPALEEGGEDEEEEVTGPTSVALETLCQAGKLPCRKSPRGPRRGSAPRRALCVDVPERCRLALRQVVAGLQCLQFFEGDDSDAKPPDLPKHVNPEDKREEEEVQKMAYPFQAIPMPYASLSKHDPPIVEAAHENTPSVPGRKTLGSRRKKKEGRGVGVTPEGDGEAEGRADTSPRALLCKSKAEVKLSWRAHLRALLHEKARLVYATLAERAFAAERHGEVLRHARAALRCHCTLARLRGAAPGRELAAHLLTRAADACFMMAPHWGRVQHGPCAQPSDDDLYILRDAELEGCLEDLPELQLIPEEVRDVEQVLLASRDCYTRAFSLETERQGASLRRRLGNVENELGKLYMEQAGALCRSPEASGRAPEVQLLFRTSLRHLEAGVQHFKAIGDRANLAVLHLNVGRLMRMCAHFHSPDASVHRSSIGATERAFYNKATSSYQSALMELGHRRASPEIWDSAVYELSTTYFTLACLLQDFPPTDDKSVDDVERDVVDLFTKTLKYCDVDTPGPTQPVYQFREATVHARLASLYHKSFRSVDADDPKRKNLVQLSKLHYEKAARLMSHLEQVPEFLRVQMERVALAEFQAESTQAFGTKVKLLGQAVELMVQCVPMLKLMAGQPHGGGGGGPAAVAGGGTEEQRLVQLLRQRLQFALQSLVKLHMGRAGAKKECDPVLQAYKNMYSLALQSSAEHLSDLISFLLDVLPKIEQLSREANLQNTRH
ncbi:erythroid differentiation-related factor 1 isoform X2 [Bacillus rossius redtenbacheri]|uniref:erythroid differentiation-related factor 1 isoform X2 n=1 Tax=Bacillus rossius redtenbacheri TaxID=93214 RepID=UPI002FDE90A5